MSSPVKQVVVTGAFDDIRSRQIRFLEEASKLGELTVLLWSDEAVQAATGKPPKFPQPERLYFLNAVRYVTRVLPLTGPVSPDTLPNLNGASSFSLSSSGGEGRGEEASQSINHQPSTINSLPPQLWVDLPTPHAAARRAFCQQHGLEYHVLSPDQLQGFPEPPLRPSTPGQKKVVVTGCYDWFHSGHVRFFEEVSAHGDLYVIVGHDANIRLLKGDGHPLLPQDERRYVAGSIRYVTQALVSSGDGWLDADPEIKHLKPHIYAVNEDGDKGGKGEYCAQRGIQYLVLKRTPAPGLPRRSSTDLRGF